MIHEMMNQILKEGGLEGDTLGPDSRWRLSVHLPPYDGDPCLWFYDDGTRAEAAERRVCEIVPNDIKVTLERALWGLSDYA